MQVSEKAKEEEVLALTLTTDPMDIGFSSFMLLPGNRGVAMCNLDINFLLQVAQRGGFVKQTQRQHRQAVVVQQSEKKQKRKASLWLVRQPVGLEFICPPLALQLNAFLFFDRFTLYLMPGFCRKGLQPTLLACCGADIWRNWKERCT